MASEVLSLGPGGSRSPTGQLTTSLRGNPALYMASGASAVVVLVDGKDEGVRVEELGLLRRPEGRLGRIGPAHHCRVHTLTHDLLPIEQAAAHGHDTNLAARLAIEADVEAVGVVLDRAEDEGRLRGVRRLR